MSELAASIVCADDVVSVHIGDRGVARVDTRPAWAPVVVDVKSLDAETASTIAAVVAQHIQAPEVCAEAEWADKCARRLRAFRNVRMILSSPGGLTMSSFTTASGPSQMRGEDGETWYQDTPGITTEWLFPIRGDRALAITGRKNPVTGLPDPKIEVRLTSANEPASTNTPEQARDIHLRKEWGRTVDDVTTCLHVHLGPLALSVLPAGWVERRDTRWQALVDDGIASVAPELDRDLAWVVFGDPQIDVDPLDPAWVPRVEERGYFRDEVAYGAPVFLSRGSVDDRIFEWWWTLDRAEAESWLAETVGDLPEAREAAAEESEIRALRAEARALLDIPWGDPEVLPFSEGRDDLDHLVRHWIEPRFGVVTVDEASPYGMREWSRVVRGILERYRKRRREKQPVTQAAHGSQGPATIDALKARTTSARSIFEDRRRDRMGPDGM